MRVDRRALKHGCSDEDIRRAVAEHLISFPVSLTALPDHDAVGYVGPDQAGNLLEVFTYYDDEEHADIAIHAMKARKQFLDLL